jgi:hypothetical protein
LVDPLRRITGEIRAWRGLRCRVASSAAKAQASLERDKTRIAAEPLEIGFDIDDKNLRLIDGRFLETRQDSVFVAKARVAEGKLVR